MKPLDLINEFVTKHSKDIELLTHAPELIHSVADYKLGIKFITQVNIIADLSKNKDLELLYEKLALTMAEKHGDKVFTDLILEKI